jgi:hypothetical protein
MTDVTLIWILTSVNVSIHSTQLLLLLLLLFLLLLIIIIIMSSAVLAVVPVLYPSR